MDNDMQKQAEAAKAEGPVSSVRSALEAIEQAEMEERVVFGPKQQERVNQLIAEAQGRAAKETRAELATARERLAKLESQQPPSREEIEALERRAAEAKAAVAEAEATAQSAHKNAQLLSACQGFIEPELVATLLKSETAFIDGELRPVNSHGSPLLNKHGEPMTIAEHVRGFEEKRPWLTHSTVKGGVGSTAAKGNSSDELRVEDFYGPTATRSRELHQLCIQQNATYRRLRAAALTKGWVR
ncbi:MAG TPA: hypothetical protein VN736_25940 [Candidatus Limnocylindrales bacterium]|nr:hypothetical protein [Candidatus Limnocylindrales bacterium]